MIEILIAGIAAIIALYIYLAGMVPFEQDVKTTPIQENRTLPPTPEPIAPIVPKPKPDASICGVAKSLCWYDTERGINTLLTIKEIERWILDNIEYEYHYYPRGVPVTWADKRGDCTDMAMLAKQMLSCLDIDSEYRHGLTGGEVKHDWLRTDEYTLFVQEYPGGCQDLGRGFW